MPKCACDIHRSPAGYPLTLKAIAMRLTDNQIPQDLRSVTAAVVGVRYDLARLIDVMEAQRGDLARIINQLESER